MAALALRLGLDGRNTNHNWCHEHEGGTISAYASPVGSRLAATVSHRATWSLPGVGLSPAGQCELARDHPLLDPLLPRVSRYLGTPETGSSPLGTSIPLRGLPRGQAPTEWTQLQWLCDVLEISLRMALRLGLLLRKDGHFLRCSYLTSRGGRMMGAARSKAQPREQRSNNEVRQLILHYFYDRNRNATSSMGKKGSAVKISDVKGELKAEHGLSQQEVQSNLTYLRSQGWVETIQVEKQVRARGGTAIPSVTNYYQVTAAGIDKIEGPGEFTRDRFHGIRIEATGQNVITLGDGNQVNIRFRDAGEALAGLREAVKESSTLDDATKVDLVVDIDSIQDQLAKPQPNKSVIRILWSAVEKAAGITGLAETAAQVVPHLHGLLK